MSPSATIGDSLRPLPDSRPVRWVRATSAEHQARAGAQPPLLKRDHGTDSPRRRRMFLVILGLLS